MNKYLMFLLVFIPSIAHPASFNCKAHLTQIEKRICDNEELSRLDEQLAGLYKYVKIDSVNKNSQLEWIKKRNNCIEDSCIEKAYRNRIDFFASSGIPITKCLDTEEALSNYAASQTDGILREDRKVDLNGDGLNEIIYSEGMCNVHCPYSVYEKINGCYYGIAAFSAREYFVVASNDEDIKYYLGEGGLADHKKKGDISKNTFSCLIINDVEQHGDLTIGPSYQPLCFPKKQSAIP